jgi:hypothetical protein
MIKLTIQGLEETKRNLNKQATEEAKRILTDYICEKLSETASHARNFRFTLSGSNLILDPKSVSPELYAKIAKALA